MPIGDRVIHRAIGDWALRHSDRGIEALAHWRIGDWRIGASRDWIAARGVANATAALLSGSVLPGTNVSPLDRRLVTPSAMSPVRLGMTLDEARQALPDVSFARTTDGAVLVLAAFGKDDKLTLWAEEDDPDASIDWSRQVTT
ncbi:MAG: hypothetical protein IT179_05125 [Acidobacteria bacterium]|nr:hypothetical protein [Acidobacteriota bacterium]